MVLGTACDASSATAPLPRIPASALPNLHAGPATGLGAGDVADEAIDVEALASLLDAAGFVSGTERRFTGSATAVRAVRARLLRFGSVEGAARYLGWLRGHADDLIGDVAGTEAIDLRGAVVFVHVPGGCCPKETTVYLAAWQRGNDVISLVAGGPAMDADLLAALATSMDAVAREI